MKQLKAKKNSDPVIRTRGQVRKEGAEFPVAPPRSELPADYAEVLADIKNRIRQARLRTLLAANSDMVLLYWDIGHTILSRQAQAGWGGQGYRSAFG